MIISSGQLLLLRGRGAAAPIFEVYEIFEDLRGRRGNRGSRRRHHQQSTSMSS